MKKSFHIILTSTLVISGLNSQFAYPSILSTENFKNYYRISISIPKDQIYLKHYPGVLEIETLDHQAFKEISSGLTQINPNDRFIDQVDSTDAGYPKSPAKITLRLKNEGIEVFNFFKENEQKYILDFWDGPSQKNNSMDQSISGIEKTLESKVRAKGKDTKDLNISQKQRNPSHVSKEDPKNANSIVEIPPSPEPGSRPVPEGSTQNAKGAPVEIKQHKNEYRDFRYGAAFIWDYPPFIPHLQRIINLKRKTPEYFYPIVDREFLKDEKEAHVQLSINLYRQEKWGLMAKSIDLYAKKYGEDSNFEINEYLKANALLRNNIKGQNSGPIKSAILKFVNLSERTENYQMKKGILQYLISYMIENNDFMSALQFSKQLYVSSKADFDEETSEYAAESILFNLSKLKQIEKIESFIKEKSIQVLIPNQLRLAFLSYVYLERNKLEEAIQIYEKNLHAFEKPVHPAILFNTAEAYFRNSDYEKAIRTFDEFIKSYSFERMSSHARLRIALAYEITDRNINEVLELYKDAINKVSDPQIRYEAKVRYVGIRHARKRQMNRFDKESIIFLESSPAEKKEISPDLKKLLWLVRLRTLINDKKYNQALTYLKTLPIEAMKPAEKRSFQGDGAEIIYGIIKEEHNLGNYEKSIRYWEKHKNNYFKKMAKNPHVSFIICDSYLNLGLNQSFEKALEYLKSINDQNERLFPVWVENNNNYSMPVMIHELEMAKNLKAQDWERAKIVNEQFLKSNPKFPKGNFYNAIINYHQKRHSEAIKDFERYFLESENSEELEQKEMAELFLYYTESLYSMNEMEKFKKYVDAVTKKTDKIEKKSTYLKSMLEKMNYLAIEVLSSNVDSKDYLEVDEKIEYFKKNFPKSSYENRIDYLLGVYKIRNNQTQEGQSILNNLINNTKVPEYLRELARTELSFLKFKNREF